MNTKFFYHSIGLAITITMTLGLITLAQAATITLDPLQGGDYGSLENSTGLGSTDPVVVASQLVNVFLRVLGLLCVLLMLYGGFRWIWARGNEEEISTAKDIIRGTVIGLVVVLSSFGIMQWVFYYLTRITNAQ
ncbi:MAG: hypothetical protein HYV33_06145 [Candidatus Kerfeldbacteria bacterium]|nr:hypothetical protein [Candidatus Kerfeldbacteria bacterium]